MTERPEPIDLLQGTLDLLILKALHRLEQDGWLAAEWGESENNRRAKYYQLTPSGRRQLRTKSEHWQRVSLAMGRALRAT